MTEQKRALALDLRTAYKRSFVSRVHELLALAFAKIHTSDLASLEEPDITGRIVTAMREIIEGPMRLRWASHFSVHDDRPISDDDRRGKARRRIDIEIERTTPGPHPRFQFEAKRMWRSDSVANYVGPDGLRAYLDGSYGSGHETAGMLAYVQTGDAFEWATKVRRKLARDRGKLGIRDGGNVWAAMSIRTVDLPLFRSRHSRPSGPIEIIHTFLLCR